MKLTKAQEEAIYSDSSNILVNASAGSGKTAVFAARITNLVNKKDVDPERILALTFSKDAAENMRKRVSKFIGEEEAEKIHMSTFHSFAYGLLYSRFAPYYKEQQMMKDWWKTNQLYAIAGKPTAQNPDGLALPITAPELGMFISYQKSNMILKKMPVLIDEGVAFAREEDREVLQKAYKMFMEHSKNARLIEYDDLLLHLYYRFVQSDEFRNEIKNKYDYIMVDEFQDTSHINLEMLKMISEDNLFVVGDFRQGIYGFINADIKNILNFSQEFNDVHVIELRENFRSTETIVNLSNKIIEHRDIPEYKQFQSAKSAIGERGNMPTVTIYNSEHQEAMSIVDKIEAMVDDDEAYYQDFAILLRTNAQMGIFESEFAKRGMPVDVSTSRSFFNRREIDTLLCYLKGMFDKSDNLSISRILNTPSRYISNKDIHNLDEFAYANGLTLFETLIQYTDGKVTGKLNSLVNLLRKYSDEITPEKMLRTIIASTGFFNYLEKTSKKATDYEMKVQSVESLINLSKNFSTIQKFLTHVSIIESNSKKKFKDSVKIMTVHASKGLEFEHVFIPSLSDQSFPHKMCGGNIEEEARLVYVAISRAKRELDISYSIESSDPEEAYAKPSRFILPAYPELKKAQKRLFMGEKLVKVA